VTIIKFNKAVANKMKQSGQLATHLQFHKNSFFFMTVSYTLCKAKLNDTESGYCSNRALGHQTTSYQAILYNRTLPVDDVMAFRLSAANKMWRSDVKEHGTLSVKDIRQSVLSTTLQ